jgi:hypothetical protein
MNIIKIVLSGFLIIEITNVVTLYLFPGSKYANAIGIFNAWDKSKGDPEIHYFVKYLVNWVAGTKLIFIMLLVVIIHVADQRLLFFTCIALVFSIVPFYWRLLPILRRMDQNNQITPHKYSFALGVMISVFIAVFVVCIALSVV